MINKKHTPIPWKLEEIAISDKSGLNFHTWFLSENKVVPLSQANAEFIVQCVNSHDILLEALKEARNVLNAPVYMHIKNMLDEVIAKAEA